MWRFFNALSILSAVVLLGLQGGQARSLPEQPQRRPNLDCMNYGKTDSASANAPHSNWAPPAEIAAKARAVEPRSVVSDGALAWRPPAEIAAVRPAADIVVALAGSASPSPALSNWAPPAEIAAEAPAIEPRSAVSDGALVWMPPAEIAAARLVADGVDTVVALAGPASPSPVPSNWAPPAEIGAKAPAVEHRSAVTDGALVWRPPAEIARPKV